MSKISDYKNEINGKIATLKAVLQKRTSKIIKDANDSKQGLIETIMDIYEKLGGYNDLIKSMEIILSSKLDDIEETTKSAIKTTLKQIISCGIEPTIGDELILTGTTFDIKKIDPLSVFSIDPESENGSYGYFDNKAGVNSRDFNVFIYTVIKNSINDPNYQGAIWYKTGNGGTSKTPLLDVKFKESDQNKSNQLIIKINESFRGYPLSYFISEYLDSIKLFNNVNLISSIFDEILRTKIISINKPQIQIEIEKTIAELVEKIINNVEDEYEVIDDSFFAFSNDFYDKLIEETEEIKRNTFRLTNIDNKTVSVDEELLLESLNNLKNDSLLVTDQTKIIIEAVDAITNDLIQKGNLNPKFSFSFKFDLFKKIITKLTTTITLYTFSPKIILLFSMTTKMYGLENSDDVIGFIKENINIYKIIILKIRDIITDMLIDKIKKMISPLIKQLSIDLIKEKFAIYKKQLDNIIKLIKDSKSLVENASEKITDII